MFCAAMVKRGYTTKQLSNLSRGRAKRKKKSLPMGVFKRGSKYYRHIGTSMSDEYRYGKFNPSAATKTKQDILHEKVVEALPRINNARSKTLPRTMLETTMLLQFVLSFILTNACMLSRAVNKAVEIFGWRRDTVFAATNA